MSTITTSTRTRTSIIVAAAAMVAVAVVASSLTAGILFVFMVHAFQYPTVRIAAVEQNALTPLWTFHDNSPGRAFLGAAAIANFDADPALEVASFSISGKVFVLNPDGSKSWEFQTAPGSSPVDHLQWQAYPSPSFGDFDGDGAMEVVVGTDAGILYVLHDTNHDGQGEVLWSYDVGGWIHTSPAVADLNDDGILEVVLGADDRNLYVLNDANDDGQGEVLWSYDVGQWVHSSPAIADMDGDGRLDVVIGGLALRTEGKPLWIYDRPPVGVTTPAIGDINADGVLDAIFGCAHFSVCAVTDANKDAQAELLWSHTLATGIAQSAALGDMNGDGILEVAVASTGDFRVLDAKTGEELWSYTFDWIIVSSPALANIDEDPELEIIIGDDDYKYVALEDADHDGQGEVVWAFSVRGDVDSSPVVADINGDGKLDAIFGSGGGNLYAVTIGKSATGNTPRPWPKFHRDQWNTGRYDYPFRRGDADGSGLLNLTDVIFTLNFLFTGGPAPLCQDAADANDDGNLGLSDAVSMLRYLFSGGEEPPLPGPEDIGHDPTPDNLACTSYPSQ